MTALSGKAALCVAGCECDSPWRQAILTGLYRDTALYWQTALLGEGEEWESGADVGSVMILRKYLVG